MSEWISVKTRLPELPQDVPNYAMRVSVLTWREGGRVKELRYERNMYAKTEKGRSPRWAEPNGRLAYFQPTHWMPLPEPPKETE